MQARKGPRAPAIPLVLTRSCFCPPGDGAKPGAVLGLPGPNTRSLLGMPPRRRRGRALPETPSSLRWRRSRSLPETSPLLRRSWSCSLLGTSSPLRRRRSCALPKRNIGGGAVLFWRRRLRCVGGGAILSRRRHRCCVGGGAVPYRRRCVEGRAVPFRRWGRALPETPPPLRRRWSRSLRGRRRRCIESGAVPFWCRRRRSDAFRSGRRGGAGRCSGSPCWRRLGRVGRC